MLSHLPIVVQVIYFIRSWKGPRIFGLRLSLGSRSLQKTWGDGRAGGTEGREQKYSESDEELSLPVQEGSSDKNEAELILQSITEMIVVTRNCREYTMSNYAACLFGADGTPKLSCSVDFTAKLFELWQTESTLWIQRSHKDDKFVSCPECAKLFALETTLKKHL